MAGGEELSDYAKEEAYQTWEQAAKVSELYSEQLLAIGLHKQWANRLTEWCRPIKVVVTGTEWDNFFFLRDDEEAVQPEFYELVQLMKRELERRVPTSLQPGDWHLPYIDLGEGDDGVLRYYIKSNDETASASGYITLDLETAKKISASCCAQVSYRNLDTSLEKALNIYEKLFSGPKPHLSPVEHQATPIQDTLDAWDFEDCINLPPYRDTWEEGITHLDRRGNLWSANFKGWIQHRQLIQK